MEFVKLTEEEYYNFWNNHPLKTFLSAKEIGTLRKNMGWDVHFLGVRDKDTITAAAMLVSKVRRFGKKEFYSPRGFLLDFNDTKLLTFFTENLKKYVKKEGGYILRIDPYVIYKQRDIDGNIVQDGIDNSSIVEELLRLGFKRVSESDMDVFS